VLPLELPTCPPGVRAAFTSRAGGVSPAPYAELNLGPHVGDDPALVAENRSRVAAAIGLPVGRLVFAEQVHGVAVALVGGPVVAPPVADVLVTRVPRLALAVMVADCVPVLLADPVAGVVAVAHAGRRGVEAGVVGVALDAMVDCGAAAGDTTAWLGPAIGGCCYEVPEQLQRAVAAVAPGTVVGGGRTRSGSFALDLRDGVQTQLVARGVRRVVRSGGCTHDDADYFSHRRDGVTGRFAGLVWLTGER